MTVQRVMEGLEWRSGRLLRHAILCMYLNGALSEDSLICRRMEMMKRELNLTDEDLRRIAHEIYLQATTWHPVVISDIA